MKNTLIGVYLVVGWLAAALLPAWAVPALAEEPRFWGLSYSPSRVLSEAQLAAGVSEQAIARDLAQLKPLTSRLRTYTVDRGIDAVPRIAGPLGLKVSLGLWLGPDRRLNELEVTRGLGVIASHRDVIERVFVGNETLERGDLTVPDLMAYIARVKAAAPDVSIGTAEAWSMWLAHRELATVVDFVGLHLLPYWDGVPVAAAVDYSMGRFDEIVRAFPQKKIIVSETGWPTAGHARQAAVPSPEGQRTFVRGFIAQAERRKIDFFVVDAFDQPWKASSAESSVGPHWGLFDANGVPKITLSGR